MLIVVFSNVNPCDLWIVKPQESLKGSYFMSPLSIGVIGTIRGNESSYGTAK